MKTKIPSLSYNAMFKAVISNNKCLLKALVKAILDYYGYDLDINSKEIVMKNTELKIDNFQDKQLICDYIIKINDDLEINIEINRNKYIGLFERNLTYSFKIYSSSFDSGDDYHEYEKFTFLQVNFNNFNNPNGKIINRFYLIDEDDLNYKLTDKFSILNIDIAKCFDLVYNENNLDEMSDIYVFGAILYPEYLEDIKSILERGLLFMKEKDKERFINDIELAARNKDTREAIQLEKTLDDRMKWIEAAAKEHGFAEGHREGCERGREEGRKEGRKEGREETKSNIIKAMLNDHLDYDIIAKYTGVSIDKIKKIELENHKN